MEDTITKSIDVKIGKFMDEQKLTVERMSALLGMTPTTLRWKRRGEKDWKWSEILRLADLLGESPDELAGIA